MSKQGKTYLNWPKKIRFIEIEENNKSIYDKAGRNFCKKFHWKALPDSRI